MVSAEPGLQERRICADSSLGMSLWPSRLAPSSKLLLMALEGLPAWTRDGSSCPALGSSR